MTLHQAVGLVVEEEERSNVDPFMARIPASVKDFREGGNRDKYKYDPSSFNSVTKPGGDAGLSPITLDKGVYKSRTILGLSIAHAQNKFSKLDFTEGTRKNKTVN